MRIIRGTLKGRKINAPNSIKARPTTDFAKESLFNILENTINLEDKQVLDLFTGTGNISFEFASRGAKNIISIDINYASIKFVNQTAEKLNLPVKASKIDVFKYLNISKEKFDIIFADPPYQSNRIKEIPEMIFNSGILNKSGILILEHGFENDFSLHKNLIDKRTYSRVNFSFFKAL